MEFMPGSTKRLGVRYGRRIRAKLDAIETAQKTAYKCPYCHKSATKRIAVGIWHCTKCNSTFTGKAYSLEKGKIFEEQAQQAVAEISLEKEEGEEAFEEEQ
jgi:large subunit ribosomal protein L37Ae